MSWDCCTTRRIILIIGAPLLPLVGHVAGLERRLMDPAREGVVLLAGSSYFEMWETFAQDLAHLDNVNVGIGGTRIGDQLHDVDRLVFPFNPRALSRAASLTKPDIAHIVR